MPSINTLFIAEKPSLAEAIAMALADKNGLPEPSRSGGAWRVGSDAVTWLYGHVLEQAQPHEYDARWKSRGIDQLPIIIQHDKWKANVVEKHAAHVAAIAVLAKEARSYVNAGDAAREGQLLVDELLLHLRIDPYSANVRRIWVSSMARKDLIAALAAMAPNSEKRTLCDAAASRARADWLIGMNYSRLYTGLTTVDGGQWANISVGRVQTPTLRLITERDIERKNFRAIDYFVPVVTVMPGRWAATWSAPDDGYEGLDAEGRLVDRAAAEKIVRLVKGSQGKVTAYTSEPKSKAPPLPYSLSALQAECSAKLGLSAQETLDTAQRLYEQHRATTYPRTDSRYLPQSLLDDVPGIVRALAGTADLGEAAKGADTSLRSAVWDDSKVSDHHAIIPTTEFDAGKLAGMDDTEKAVFAIVARAFLAQFYPPQKYRATSAAVTVEGHVFSAAGRQVTDAGWRRVYGAELVDDDDEAAQALPPLQVGADVMVLEAEATARKTKAPPAWTDGTLILAMTGIHRFVSDPEAKKRLRESDGIGTEATRANILETLIAREYVARRGKTLESTEQGRSIIANLPRDLSDAALTALQERKLAEVQAGTLRADAYLDELQRSIADRVRIAKSGGGIVIAGAPPSKFPPRDCGLRLDGDGSPCPKCGTGKLLTRTVTKQDSPHRGKPFLSCSGRQKDGTGCTYTAWPQSPGACPAAQVEPLPGDGGKCPQCGKGLLKTKVIVSKKDGRQHTVLGCNAYPGCTFTKFPDRKEKAPAGDIPPIAGHGKACPKCAKGKMMTKQITSKKDGKTYTVLSCDQYPRCQNSEFPPFPRSSAGGRR